MILENHRIEINDQSAVDPQIAVLNFWSITDPSEADKLLNRNNDKRWKHSDNLVPGWAVTGIDPQTEERWLQGVQLKPDTPILNGFGRTLIFSRTPMSWNIHEFETSATSLKFQS